MIEDEDALDPPGAEYEFEKLDFELTIDDSDEDGPPELTEIRARSFPEEILVEDRMLKSIDPEWIRATLIVQMRLTNGEALYVWTNGDDYRKDLAVHGFPMRLAHLKETD